jgi:ABC-type glutathione transport system ATPase component
MNAEPFLSVRRLGRRFAPRGWWGKAAAGRWAIRDISFELERGRTLVLAGASGAGKSTLARCLARFETPDTGEVRLMGRPVGYADVQLIQQQPAASFNPRFSAGEAVAEPLAIQKHGRREDRRETARQAMARVGLLPDAAARPVMEFSGGEHQRLAIARALTLQPKLLILDESLSALDAFALDQVLELLRDLQGTLALTYIVISHDLALAERMADEIAVLDDGAMVEYGPRAGLLAAPRHPRTQELARANLVLSAEGPPL